MLRVKSCSKVAALPPPAAQGQTVLGVVVTRPRIGAIVELNDCVAR
jgi:hypothetical protein